MSLIVAKAVDCPEINERRPTVTEIKRVANRKHPFILDDIGSTVTKVPPRMIILTFEVIKLINNTGNIKNGDVLAFKVPFEIGGQTYSDQTGYGSYYEGDDCIYKGTYYGQTTSFYIVGIIVNMR